MRKKKILNYMVDFYLKNENQIETKMIAIKMIFEGENF